MSKLRQVAIAPNHFLGDRYSESALCITREQVCHMHRFWCGSGRFGWGAKKAPEAGTALAGALLQILKALKV
jgi:hypothetical protein